MSLVLIIAVSTTPSGEMPSATDLVNQVLADWRAEQWHTTTESSPLMEALIDLGRLDEAREVARGVEGELVEPYMQSMMAIKLLKRTGEVPDMRRLLAGKSTYSKGEVYSYIVEGLIEERRLELAESHLRDAIENAEIRKKMGYSLTRLLIELRQADDCFGVRRVSELVTEGAPITLLEMARYRDSDGAFRIMIDADLKTALGKALGEMKLLETDDEIKIGEVEMFSRLCRWKAATGDREGAEAGYKKIEQLMEEFATVDYENSKPVNNVNSIYGTHDLFAAYYALSWDARRAGFQEHADQWRAAYQKVLRESDAHTAGVTILLSTDLIDANQGRLAVEQFIGVISNPYQRAEARNGVAMRCVSEGKLNGLASYVWGTELIVKHGRDVYEDRLKYLARMSDIGYLYVRLGNKDEGRRIFRELIDSVNDDPVLLRQVGEEQCHCGLVKEAYATLNRIPADNEEHATLLYALAAAAAEKEALAK